MPRAAPQARRARLARVSLLYSSLSFRSPFLLSGGKKERGPRGPRHGVQPPKAAICSAADLRLVVLLAATGCS